MDPVAMEEMNKIRRAMGVAALPNADGSPSTDAGLAFKSKKEGDNSDDEPASTLETRAAAGYDNWAKLQQEKEAETKRAARKEAIKKELEKAHRLQKLQGKGIAEIEDDVDDKTWLMQSKKRQKKIEKSQKLMEQLEEKKQKAEAARAYTEADLAGVKVAHEVDAFGEGEEQILVLKDTAVDDEDDDELEAVALAEKERLQEKLDSKKRKRVYDPNADEQTSILAQYDEEIEGKKRKVFTLDGQGRTVEGAQSDEANASKPKKIAFSLDILKDDTPVNDYMDISEIKVKKPKKKKSKAAKKRRTDDDDDDIFPPTVAPVDDDAMDVDEPKPVTRKPKKVVVDEDLDEELQTKLAAQRQAALKKRKKASPEELARRLREEATATPDVMDTIEDNEPGLVIDETTEFVTNLDLAPTPEHRERPKSKSRTPAPRRESIDSQGDMDMERPDEAAEAPVRAVSVEVPSTGIDEEAALDGGMGQALKLLKQRGLVGDSNSDDLNAYYRERQRFLADKRKVEESAERLAKDQRERDRNSGRLSHMTPRERERHAQQLNAQRDQQESRRLADIFNREYKPNVQLNYVDEHGRHMNEKEAFKHLSHQFHGKGSGNQKTAKHLEKIATEKKRMAESSLDSSKQVGMNNAQGVQSRKHKQAGVRLQ